MNGHGNIDIVDSLSIGIDIFEISPKTAEASVSKIFHLIALTFLK